MLVSLVFAACLVLLGAGLVVWHARTWRDVVARGASGKDLKFAQRQFGRRATASLLIAAVGGLVAGGEWIVSPIVSLVYWLAVLLIVLWILALAAADAFASRQYFAAEQSQQDAEFLLLSRKLREHADASAANGGADIHHRNGHPPTEGGSSA